MNAIEMKQLIDQYKIKSHTTNNDLSEPIAFNLMFSTSIGPESQKKWFVQCEALYI
jgi:glycyl-tRNA synthetase